MTATPIASARNADAPHQPRSDTTYTGSSTAKVNAAATGYDSSANRRLRLLVLSGGVALVAAVRLPVELAVFAVLVFGLPHVVLELRYVIGRFRVPGRLWAPLAVVLAIAVLNRFAWTGRGPRVAETLLLGGLLLVGLGPAAPGEPSVRRRFVRVLGAVATGAALVLALAGLDSWFLVQAHLHNILPVLFLWDWTATEVPPVDRARWRLALVALFVAVPAVVLSGALDPLIGGPGGILAGTAEADRLTKVSANLLPAGAGAPWPTRLVAAFAYAQLAHYAVWCWFLPGSRAGTEATASVASRPWGRWARGWTFVALLGAGSAVIALLAWVDLVRGRSTYTSLAASHALLEYPLLVLLARGVAAPRNLS